MDSFEDLENPPVSIQNVVNNRWLNNSFKETVCTEFLAFDHLTKLHFNYTMIFHETLFYLHRLLHQVVGPYWSRRDNIWRYCWRCAIGMRFMRLYFFLFFLINSHTFFNFILCVQVQDGFIAHFYAVCEHISPVLAWGFLGPKNSLHDFCCFFKVKCNLMTSVS